MVIVVWWEENLAVSCWRDLTRGDFRKRLRPMLYSLGRKTKTPDPFVSARTGKSLW
jgi:hypothetical protein